jgi:hypothetical protein
MNERRGMSSLYGRVKGEGTGVKEGKESTRGKVSKIKRTDG